MEEHQCRRNVMLYRIYALFNEPLFWGPILITSLQRLGHLSLPGIYYMESIVVAAVCLPLDIPAGVLGDLFGRRTMVIIGRSLYLVSTVLFACMHSPLDAWIANILCMAGVSTQRGSDDALLYDSLKVIGREAQYEEVQGKACGNWFLIAAPCALVAGIVADPGLAAKFAALVLGVHVSSVAYESLLRLLISLCIPFMAIPLIAACFFAEPPRFKNHTIRGKINELQSGTRLALRCAPVLWMLGFAALLNTTSKLWFFAYNPYFELVHLPVVQYGFVFCLLSLVAWLASRYASRALQLGEGRCIVMMVLCLALPIILMGAFPSMVFAYLVSVQNVVRGFMKPFVTGYLNRHVGAAARATIHSVQSTTSWLVSIAGLAAFGFVTASLSLTRSFLVLGVCVLVLGSMSYLCYLRWVSNSAVFRA